MSRAGDIEQLPAKGKSAERPQLLAHTFDEVAMQHGSLRERTQEANLTVSDWVLGNLPVEDTRDKVDLKLVRIPKGMTAEQVWELLKADPEYRYENGEVEWELAGVEHQVALDADPRLKNLKDKSYWIMATRSSVDVEGSREVPFLFRWEDGNHKLNRNWLDNQSNGRNFLLLVRTFLWDPKLFLPAAEHFADFGKRLADSQVWFVLQNVHFPG